MPTRRKKKRIHTHKKQHKAKQVTVKKKNKINVIKLAGSGSFHPNDEKRKGVNRPILCKKDAKGVERLLCPYNTFHIKRPAYRRKKRMSGQAHDYYSYSQGISPKERNYLVCSCQRQSCRYSLLKAYAARAVKENKIFTVCGQCPYVRKALVSRGWVEKIPAARMDVTALRSKQYSDQVIDVQLERLLLSTLVEKASPKFIWNARDDFDPSRDTTRHSNALFNRLRQEATWTSKQGLCMLLQNYRWCHIDDKAEVQCPRTYTTFTEEDREEFLDDYKLTACTSLLKWLLSMAANNRKVSDFAGTVSLDVVVFALNRCREYLVMKNNEDLDSFTATNITKGQWDTFLKNYYSLMAKEDLLALDTENMLPVYREYGIFILKQIYTFRPQLSCEGCHNIWIIKPTHCSRGRGIRMASKLGVLSDLLKQGKYVFQKYIEEPLLIHDTKFDIRQYYLVTNTSPLEIWSYKDCYLKFSSQKYNLKNFHESIHLTNHAVQKKYNNCRHRHPELPDTNMWILETYKEYLRERKKENLWEEVIYPGMRKAILGIMLCCQEEVVYNKNRFELFGCDFILDKDYTPWLIEINSSPDLNGTTDVTSSICPAVIEDLVKVMVDRADNPRASTGNFECIYRENYSVHTYRGGHDLTVQGHALKLKHCTKEIPMSDVEVIVPLETPLETKSELYDLKDFDSLMEKLKEASATRHVRCNTSPRSKSEKLEDSREKIKSAVANTACPVSNFLNKLTSKYVTQLSSCKSFLSFSSSKNFSPEETDNGDQENCAIDNDVVEQPVQTTPLAPISGDLNRKEKVMKSPGSESPGLQNKDKTKNLNFGDYNPKKQAEIAKRPVKENKTIVSDILAATNNLCLFFKQKELEYSKTRF